MLLSNIFKPKWQHANPDVRKKALLSLNESDSDSKQVIISLAKSDPEAEIRRLAIKKVSDLDLIKNSMENDEDLAVREIAKKIYIQALSGNSPLSPSEVELVTIIKDITDQNILEHIFSSSENEEIKKTIIPLLKKASSLENIIKKNNPVDLQLMALDKIDSADALERIIKKCRTKSKKITNAAKSKLNKINEAREKPLKIEKTRKTICGSLESLAKLGYNDKLSSELARLQKSWSDIENECECSEELLERYQNGVESCNSILSEHDDIERERLILEEKNTSLKQEKEKVCQNLSETLEKFQNEDAFLSIDITKAKEELESSNNLWKSIEKLPLIDEQLIEKEFNNAYQNLDRYLKAAQEYPKLISEINSYNNQLQKIQKESFIPFRKFSSIEGAINSLVFPKILGKEIKEYSDLKENLSKTKKLLEAQEEKITLAKKELPKLLDELEKNIKEGSLDKATKADKKIRKSISLLPGNSSTLHRRYKSISHSLRELQDWKGWATSPKKEALCQEMESLVGSELHPEELSKQIKLLQQQWKDLSGSEKTSSQDLWKRFSEAADKAFKPCAEYFEEQSNIRKQNEEKRAVICQNLEDQFSSIDWESPDWKAVDTLINKSISDWKETGPTDRKISKDINERFNNALTPLKDKINNYRAENKAAKEELIEKVISYEELEDIQQAVEKTKLTQKQWKETGPTFRKDEQKLWKNFRKACDAVFDKRSQVYEERDSERKQNLEEKNNISNQILSIAELTGEEFGKRKDEVNDLVSKWHEISNIPKNAEKEAKDLLEKARSAVKNQEKKIYRQVQESKLLAVKNKYDMCLDIESKIFSRDKASEDELSKLKQTWEELGEGIKSYDKALNSRFESNLSFLSSDNYSEDKIISLANDNLNHKLEICLKSEILLSVDSPSEYQKERMDYQIANLADGMKSSNPDIKKEMDALIKDWYQTGIVATDKVQKLEERFSNIKKEFDRY